MKRAHRFAPGVIECHEHSSAKDVLARIALVLAFLLVLGVLGGQVYNHLIWELWGL